MNYKEFADKYDYIVLTGNDRRPPLPSRQLKEAKPFEYRLTITNTKTNKSMSFDFSMGVGILEKQVPKYIDNQYKKYEFIPFSGVPIFKRKEWLSKNKVYPKRPTLGEDVLYCLAMDADVENQGSFEEWASNYGYDEDSRKAEKIYRACKEQTDDLKRVLGAELFDKLLECTEDE